LYQQHFDFGQARSATQLIMLLEKQQWMSVIAQIMLLTTDIA